MPSIKDNIPTNEELKRLWEEGFFRKLRNIKDIEDVLASHETHINSTTLCMALKSSKILIRRGKRGSFCYIQKRNAVNKTVRNIEDELFNENLENKLLRYFKIELEDLKLNFGKSGNCTAFLLRKILEKLIFIVFNSKGIDKKLKDPNKPGKLVGLEAMINISVTEKINNIPILMPKTAQEIKGIKFLGDVSAHDPLADVDMKTIIPQMPYIITAFKELSNQL